MIFTGITSMTRETGHLRKPKNNWLDDVQTVTIQNLHVLSWSFHILCSFYTVRFNWRHIYNVAVLKKNEGQLCTLQLGNGNSSCLLGLFCNMILFIIFLCPLVGDFSLLQFSNSLSNKNRIKNTLRRVTWCGFVVGQIKFIGQNGFRLGPIFLALTIYDHKNRR